MKGPPVFGFAPGLLDAIKAADLDVLHLHGIWMYPSRVAERWAAATGKPVVISPHGMLDPWILSRGRWKKAIARALYEKHLAPVFERKLVRWLVRQPASLYGLGIPPAQYKALAADGDDGILGALRLRLERLACGFDLKENYFAQQAFGRRYGASADAALPPYLQPRNFAAVKARAAAVSYRQSAITAFLEDQPASSRLEHLSLKPELLRLKHNVLISTDCIDSMRNQCAVDHVEHFVRCHCKTYEAS